MQSKKKPPPEDMKRGRGIRLRSLRGNYYGVRLHRSPKRGEMLFFPRSFEKLLGDIVGVSLAHLEIGFGNFVSGELRGSVEKVVEVTSLILLMVWAIPNAGDTFAAHF